MNLKSFNSLDPIQARNELMKCCGALRWVDALESNRPYADLKEILELSKQAWHSCQKSDWLQAFEQHPRIGDLDSLQKKFADTKVWAGNEQGGVNEANQEVLIQLSQLNDSYFDKFGFIFIVFATGKSAPQMLDILKGRISNEPDVEMAIAAGEQLKITQLRLKKLFESQ